MAPEQTSTHEKFLHKPLDLDLLPGKSLRGPGSMTYTEIPQTSFIIQESYAYGNVAPSIINAVDEPPSDEIGHAQFHIDCVALGINPDCRSHANSYNAIPNLARSCAAVRRSSGFGMSTGDKNSSANRSCEPEEHINCTEYADFGTLPDLSLDVFDMEILRMTSNIPATHEGPSFDYPARSVFYPNMPSI